MVNCGNSCLSTIDPISILNCIVIYEDQINNLFDLNKNNTTPAPAPIASQSPMFSVMKPTMSPAMTPKIIHGIGHPPPFVPHDFDMT